MNRSVFFCVLAIFLTAGCNKKPKETVPDSPPPPSTTTPSPAKITTARSSSETVPSVSANSGGNPSSGTRTGGSGGLVQNIRQAARRTDALNEMRTLGQEISLLLAEFGRMPTKDQILAAVKTNLKLSAAINEGAFILTGTTEAGGLWAYEVDADVSPGIALIGGTAAKSTPEELARYFPKK